MRLSALPDTLVRELLSFTEVKPAPGRWRFALHATTCVTVAIIVLAVVLGPRLGIIGLTGAFLGFSAAAKPWRSRLPVLAVTAAAYVAFVTLGALAGSNPILLTVVLATVGLVGVLGYNTFVGDRPGPMFFIIGPAIASYLAPAGVPIGVIVEAGALGVGVSALTSQILQVLARSHPETDAVEAAQKAVAAYVDSPPGALGDAEIGRLRDQAYAAIFSAAMVVESAVGRQPHSKRWRRLNRRLRHLHAQVIRRLVTVRMPGSPIAVSALEQRRYLGSPSAAYLLRWTISQSSMAWFSARRLAATIVITCAVVYGLHIGHPYWAVMTAALVMTIHGDRLTLTHRALHRLAGTVLGVGLFFGIHSLHPQGSWVLVAALLLVFMIQLTAVRNYAIGVLFVTPMALLISVSGNPGVPLRSIVGERLLETAVGATISLIIIWFTGRRTPIRLVRRQFRRGLRALERVLIALADGAEASPQGFEARRDLAFEQLHCAKILQIAGRDLPPETGEWKEVEGALGVLTYTVLAGCWTTSPLMHLDAGEMARLLQRMISNLPPVGTTIVDAADVSRDLREILDQGVHPTRTHPTET
ncbi:FUSC family protein [Leekyejoonella antrihumi]|uniref:FUSC family protein n=1 Tax=Leekyejoonella antrihumi TaxID=1660198 RepID=A0A563DYB6_9MICO|nr:FUSC family protein [Leekyejoonella antrihumi]TWP35268.1 FUSC family protein [Leekyejoonella antrihumi]